MCERVIIMLYSVFAAIHANTLHATCAERKDEHITVHFEARAHRCGTKRYDPARVAAIHHRQPRYDLESARVPHGIASNGTAASLNDYSISMKHSTGYYDEPTLQTSWCFRSARRPSSSWNSTNRLQTDSFFFFWFALRVLCTSAGKYERITYVLVYRVDACERQNSRIRGRELSCVVKVKS